MDTSRSILMTALVAVGLGFAATSYGDLYFYEPFDYTAGTNLNGQGGWTSGTDDAQDVKILETGVGIGNWSDGDFDNAGFTQTGNYAGIGATSEAADFQFGNVALDSFVTSKFTDGAVTWFSYLTFTEGGADSAPVAAIGAGALEANGDEAAGEAIGMGAVQGDNDNFALYWADDGGGTFTINNSAGPKSNSRPRLMVARITWSDAGNDKLEFVPFSEGATISLTEFNNESTANPDQTIMADLDQSLFDTLSFYGEETFYDEFRIASTFDDAVNGTEVIPEPASLALLGLGGLCLIPRRKK